MVTPLNGGKIIMLFAEIFSFIVDVYGLKNSAFLIIQYSNTDIFKQWFWRLKHTLGQSLNTDPSFDDIGQWIGKGCFLKICISLIIHHRLFIEETIINKIIKKQKKLLKELTEYNYFNNKNKYIKKYSDNYILLDEKIILSYNHECFYLENIIK